MKSFRTSGGKAVDIDETAGLVQSGGEGSVYRIKSRAARLAKLYHHPTAERHRKLEAMLRHPPADPMASRKHVSIAWPQELLVQGDRGAAFAGFLMPRIDAADTLANVHHPLTRRRRNPSFDYRYLMRTAANLAIAADALHRRGYVLGDVNDQNVLVNSQALVTLIDTDSMQVRDPASGQTFRCGVGRPEFTPPELAGRDLCLTDRGVEHDMFGLGVLFFYLLMEGTHPFNGVPRGSAATKASSLAERIAAGLFPFAPGETRITVPPSAPPFELLSPELRTLFLTCFRDGHQHPAMRPSAAAWHRALDAACGQLTSCRRNDLHWFPGHLSTCPWCERATAFGADPFPRTAARARRSAPRGASTTTPAPAAARGSSPIRRTVGLLAAVAASLYLASKGCPATDDGPPEKPARSSEAAPRTRPPGAAKATRPATKAVAGDRPARKRDR